MNNRKNKTIIIISGILMLGLPLLNHVGLTLIYNNISGDIMYRTLANIINVTINILTTFILYVSLGLLINSLLRSRIKKFSPLPVIIFYILSLLIVYVSDFAFSSKYYEFVLYIIFVAFGDIVIITAAFLLCRKAVGRYKITQPPQLSTGGKIISLKNPVLRTLLFMTIVIFIYNFTVNTIETVILIVQYGFPGNFTEVMYLLEPYLSFMIYAVAGYLTMLVISLGWYKFTTTG